MAELASGAVSSLLGVLRNEAQLLGRVQGDVHFIREEMESMNSFLLHLARTEPPGGHEEQVRTWMNQVRLLAQDCNNCIDMYLFRGNPEIHLPKDRALRCLLWASWYLRMLAAKRRAAVELGVLRDRARDVGERRARYGVEIPTKTSPSSGSGGSASSGPTGGDQAAAGAVDDDDEEEADGGDVDRSIAGGPREGGGGVQDLEDYFGGKLAAWIKEAAAGAADDDKKRSSDGGTEKRTMPSIAVVVPTTNNNTVGAAGALAAGALAAAKETVGFRSILLDLPSLHYPTDPLPPLDILCYMWRDLELQLQDAETESAKQAAALPAGGQGEAAGQGQPPPPPQQRVLRPWRRSTGRWGTYVDKLKAIRQVRQDVGKEVGAKIESMAREIREARSDDLKLDLEEPDADVKRSISRKPLGVLLRLLLRSAAANKAAQPDQTASRNKAAENENSTSLAEWRDHILETASRTLGLRLELQEEDCKRILRKVFLRPQPQEQATQSTVAAPTTPTSSSASATLLREDQIKAMIDEAKGEILREVKKMMGDTSDKKQAIGEQPAGGPAQHIHQQQPDDTEETDKKMDKATTAEEDQTLEAEIAETTAKLKKIQPGIEPLLEIKWILRKISGYLKGQRALVILNLHTGRWDDIRDALSPVGNSLAGAVVVANSEECCDPSRKPMDYSLVGLYQDTLLQLATRNKRINEDEESRADPQIYREILKNCPNEFCMKIFAHALYANSKRSHEELRKLHRTLESLQDASKRSRRITEKMFKFSYNDLPKEYKNCLLYLAIFPAGYKIRRLTLTGRWVAEGLITTEDWSWHNSVQGANRCFDVLISRMLVRPVDIGATGKVKSCMVGDLIHGFITKIAKKQRIVESRLSHHLARHFSISNDIYLRGSDKVDRFLQKISESSQLTVLKVLDLEGCWCFGKNKRYLKEICCKILLLKYLSLRRTNVTRLPNEINNLHDLEVLDIRDTMVLASATRHVRLVKLKRLLAGDSIDPSSFSVLIPEKIENMLNMEVLSNVKPWNGQDLKDIGRLWQLRKLGVVIEQDDHLGKLVRAISDLHDSLRSLSITLPKIYSNISSGRPIGRLPDDICSRLKYTLGVLESLSISGITQKGQLLPLLIEKGNRVTKVTLCGTWLNQDDMKVLAELSTLRCLKLRDKAYKGSMLTFKKDEFKRLKYFIVEGSNITHITFDDGATPELEKVVLPFNGDLKLFGVENLPKLEELELSNTTTTNTNTNTNTDTDTNNNNSSTNTTTSNNTNTINNNNGTLLSIFDTAKQIAKVTLHGTLLKEDDLHNLAKKPNIRCLVLLDKSYDGSELTFKEAEFPNLNLLIVNCSIITKITFAQGSIPKLNKIIWSYTNMESLSDLNFLPRLRELELNGGLVPDNVKKSIKNHRNRPYFLQNKQEHQDQQTTQSLQDAKGATRFPFCC